MFQRARFLIVVLFSALLAGCVTTQPLTGLQTIGYERFGNFNGSEAYVCPKPRCAADNVVVAYKTDALSARDRAELEGFTGDNDGSRISGLLNDIAGARGNNSLKFRKAQSTSIGGRKALLVPFIGTGKRPDGAIIIVPDGNKAQFFAGISQRQSDGQRGAIAIARLWAKN